MPNAPASSQQTIDAFAATAPGLEATLAREMRVLGLDRVKPQAGGASFAADAPAVMRAHLRLRSAGRILLRLGTARVVHLAQLDKWARKLPWAAMLPSGAPIEIEASARRSKLYHTGAIAQRIETAARSALGPAAMGTEPFRIFVRLEKDHCTVSLDASGEPLHKRGHKLQTAKAPLRETLAAAFLLECGFAGDEPVLDPMCGSGTFVIEAAEIASRMAPGRDRDFAFLRLRGFDRERWEALKAEARSARREPGFTFVGFDRDPGAVASANSNAERAGLSDRVFFQRRTVSDLVRPEGPPGLIMVNPPYGERIGDKRSLFALYGALGSVLRERMRGWRVGLATSEIALAKATGLPLAPPGPPIPHGPLKIRLYQCAALS